MKTIEDVREFVDDIYPPGSTNKTAADVVTAICQKLEIKNHRKARAAKSEPKQDPVESPEKAGSERPVVRPSTGGHSAPASGAPAAVLEKPEAKAGRKAGTGARRPARPDATRPGRSG